MSAELKQGRTYLPVFRGTLDREVCMHPDSPVSVVDSAAIYPFERVGLDRLIAITIDLFRRSIYKPARILDVGASTGLFAEALADRGYSVTAIENNLAADVQKRYPVQPSILLAASASCHRAGELEFVAADFIDFIASSTAVWEACLLLSVVHQVYSGYAMTAVGRRKPEELVRVLQKLAQSVTHGIYFESPSSEPVNQLLGELFTPDWFLKHTCVKSYELLVNSASADGDLRPLYFLSTRDDLS
ncbi:hypothetical protein DB347_11350 [Opitutaceae bacterium EW11]|nr:hypothetical protein DB347_11350 [Opitutaceae bacterium EW11]